MRSKSSAAKLLYRPLVLRSSPKTFPLQQYGSARFNDGQDETNADRAATPGFTSLSIGSAASRKVNRRAARVEGHIRLHSRHPGIAGGFKDQIVVERCVDRSKPPLSLA